MKRTVIDSTRLVNIQKIDAKVIRMGSIPFEDFSDGQGLRAIFNFLQSLRYIAHAPSWQLGSVVMVCQIFVEETRGTRGGDNIGRPQCIYLPYHLRTIVRPSRSIR
jgi:hypothetical protein